MLEHVQKYMSKRRTNMYQDNPFPKGSDCCKPCKLQLCIYQCIYVYIYIWECIHKHVHLQTQCIFLKSSLYNRFFSYFFTRPLLSLIHYKNLCPCYWQELSRNKIKGKNPSDLMTTESALPGSKWTIKWTITSKKSSVELASTCEPGPSYAECIFRL